MYNLIIYQDHKTTVHPDISYQDCISKLVSQNIKAGFKLDKVCKHLHRKVDQLRLIEVQL